MVLSVLCVKWDWNPSLRQPPVKPEHWTHGPLFCFHPKGETLYGWFPLSSLMLCCIREEQWTRATNATDFPTFVTRILYWFYSGLSAIAWVVSRVLTEVFLSIHTLLLTWFLCGGRRACVFLAHHLYLNWIPPILMIILFK